MAIMDMRLPVTVLVGFLGSGKTTLLNHLLSSRDQPRDRKLAVIVNDFAELNIDSRLVRRADEHLVEMANGCICCTLREDLLREVRALAEMPGLDGIVIESTGIGEPLPIAQTFYMDDLPERVRLDSIVTVVDAANFWRDYGRSDMIEDGEGNPTESPLAPLLVDQLEFTNIILLNKTDLAHADDVEALEGFVKTLNPGAQLYRTAYGEIDPGHILGTSLYDYEAAMQTEAWATEWAKDGSEAEEYGFSSFVYRQEAPLEQVAFLALFEAWPTSVVRAKGFVVFADDDPVLFSLAGEDVSLEALIEGDDLSPDEVAALSADERAAYQEALALATDDTLPVTEIVVIGRNLPTAELTRMLDGCVRRRAVLS